MDSKDWVAIIGMGMAAGWALFTWLTRTKREDAVVLRADTAKVAGLEERVLRLETATRDIQTEITRELKDLRIGLQSVREALIRAEARTDNRDTQLTQRVSEILRKHLHEEEP